MQEREMLRLIFILLESKKRKIEDDPVPSLAPSAATIMDESALPRTGTNSKRARTRTTTTIQHKKEPVPVEEGIG